jgi:hypothetical protein
LELRGFAGIGVEGSRKGDRMDANGKDELIEEIDKELRAIDARLKKVLSKTDSLLKESTNEPKEGESGLNDKED